jgi:hypothetical protein
MFASTLEGITIFFSALKNAYKIKKLDDQSDKIMFALSGLAARSLSSKVEMALFTMTQDIYVSHHDPDGLTPEVMAVFRMNAVRQLAAESRDDEIESKCRVGMWIARKRYREQLSGSASILCIQHGLEP